MTSDEKTVVPSLLSLERSDLFTIGNISSSVILNIQTDTNVSNETDNLDIASHKWETIINYLPLDFYRLIESYQNIYTIEEFDKRYARNPKMCAYERYGTTNMWRPLMILNRCPSITQFNFEFIRYYNIKVFTDVLSVLISRKLYES